MKIAYTKRAVKTLQRMTVKEAQRIRMAISTYAKSGRGDVKQLRERSEYRLRVGSWRVLFERDGDTLIIVLAIGPRGDIYK